MFKKKKIDDLVNNRLFSADFKVKNQRGTFLLYFVVLLTYPQKPLCKLIRSYPVKKSSTYGSVKIGLLNFTTNKDIKSFLGLFFLSKKIRTFVVWKMAKVVERNKVFVSHEKFTFHLHFAKKKCNYFLTNPILKTVLNLQCLNQCVDERSFKDRNENSLPWYSSK